MSGLDDDFGPTDPQISLPPAREKRVRRRLSVGLSVPGQGHVAGYTSNLALHGCSVGVSRVFAPGTACRLVIQLPDQERAAIDGTVTWSRKGVGGISAMGVRFSADNPLYVGFLRRFHPEIFSG